ncbi:MAG: hypothetical protein E7618_03140 [Ruminococcaceae bacterium]|nr:hypothetical protein [Oscillospiraceae bacterium]
MNMKKRILILLVTVAMLLSVVPAVSAATTTTCEVNPGQSFVLEYQFDNVGTIEGVFSFSVPEYFTITDFSFSGLGPMGSSFYDTQKGTIATFDIDLCERITLKVYITVADNAPINQSFTLTLKYETCSDFDTWEIIQQPDDVVTIKIVERLDFTALNQQIANATKLDESKYTAKTWDALEKALTAARKAATDSKTQNEINAATDALRDAIKALEELPPPPPIDYSALRKQITIAEGLKAADYTSASFAKVTSALKTAKSMTTSNDQSKVDAAAQALKNAIAALVKVEPPKDPDYYNLNRQIAIAEALIQASYTPESWSRLQTALTNAKNARSSKDQKVVDAAATALEQAIAALEAAKPPVDFSELNKQLTIAEGLKEGRYTEPSWNSLLTAVESARNVLDSDDQAEVDAAAEMLKNAIAGLVEINYQALLDAVSRLQEHIKNEELSSLWYEMHTLLNEVEAALNGRDQEKVDDCAARLIALLTRIEEKLADMETPETVIVEKPTPTTPVDDYCNIESHRIWPILFWISLALNVAGAAFAVVYFMMKRKKTTDDTPLIDYDITDDE